MIPLPRREAALRAPISSRAAGCALAVTCTIAVVCAFLPWGG